MTDLIRSELSEGVLTLTINRPDKRNALSTEMYHQLAEKLGGAQADRSIRVVLLRGEGEDFCAGNDVGDFSARNADFRTSAGACFLRALVALEKPLVAAVSGSAIGVGTTMLLHCDMVYVTEDARLVTPFVDLGLCPEAGSSLLLPARIGHARAFAMFALAEPISGADAARIGLANALVGRDELDATALAAAQALAARPAEALRVTKRLMRPTGAITAAMLREFTLFSERVVSAEAAEAFAAFKEKRKPDFNRLG